MQHRVLVCGDREWTAIEPIRAVLQKYPPGTVVIHGAARGADTLADQVAKELGFDVDPYPADWKKFKKAAGPIRNSQMLAEGHPTEVHAFHNALEHSTGTKDMVIKAEHAGLRVTRHTFWPKP